MKRFLIGGLFVLTAAVGAAQTYYLTGAPVGWSEPGTGGSMAMTLNGVTGMYEATFSGLTAGNTYEFKVFNGTGWGGGFGNNSRIKATDSSMTVTFNPSAPADGWLDSGHRVGYKMAGVETLEVIGTFNGWADAGTLAMTKNNSFSFARYETAWLPIGTFASNTTYSFKFRSPGTWDQTNIGNNGGNGGDYTFTTGADWGQTLFIYEPESGRVAMVPEPATMAVLGLGIVGLARRRRNK